MINTNDKLSFTLKDNVWFVTDDIGQIVNQFQHKPEFNSSEFFYYSENLYIMYKYTDYPGEPFFRVIHGYYLVDKTGEILTKKKYIRFHFIKDTDLFLCTSEDRGNEIIDTNGNIIWDNFTECSTSTSEVSCVSCPIAYTNIDEQEAEAIANGTVDICDTIHFIEKDELLKMQENYYKNLK